MIFVTMTVKRSTVRGFEVVEVKEMKEMISRGLYCNCIWAFSSGSNAKARVT